MINLGFLVKFPVLNVIDDVLVSMWFVVVTLSASVWTQIVALNGE